MHPTHQPSRRVRKLEQAPQTRKRPIPQPTRAWEPEQQEPAQREPEELELEQAPQTRKRPIPRPTRAWEPEQQEPAQREPEELELEQAPQTRKRPIPRPTRARGAGGRSSSCSSAKEITDGLRWLRGLWRLRHLRRLRSGGCCRLRLGRRSEPAESKRVVVRGRGVAAGARTGGIVGVE